MRTDGIVFLNPALGDFSDLSQAAEQVKVQNILPISAIEALDVGILRWFARFDEIQQDLMLFCPAGQLLGNELRG